MTVTSHKEVTTQWEVSTDFPVTSILDVTISFLAASPFFVA